MFGGLVSGLLGQRFRFARLIGRFYERIDWSMAPGSMELFPPAQRICAELASSRGLTTVEAPPGHGKSRLAEGIVARGGRLLTHLDQQPLGPGPPWILTMGSGTHAVEFSSLADLLAVAELTIVISRDCSELISRHVPDREYAAGSLQLSPEDIATMANEIYDLAVEGIGVSLHAVTGGWPAYVHAALASVKPPVKNVASTIESLRSGPHLDRLIGNCVGEVAAPNLQIWTDLAHFDRVSNAMVDAVTVDGVAGAKRAGLPVVAAAPGWFRVLEPIRSHLNSQAGVTEATANVVGPILVAEAGLTVGLQTLVRSGAATVAAEIMLTVPSSRLDEASPSELASLLRTMRSVSFESGRLSLQLARVEHNRANLTGQRAALEQAKKEAEAVGEIDVAAEAAAELLYLDLPTVPSGEARRRAESLRGNLSDSARQSTQIRLREVDAMLLAQAEELDLVHQYVQRFHDVSGDWALSGEMGRAAATLRALIATSLIHLGRYNEAQTAAEEACAMVSSHPYSLAKSVGLLARVASLRGDLARFRSAASRTSELLRSVDLAWVRGYLSWSTMTASGFNQDRDGVDFHHRQAKAQLGDLHHHPTWVVFLAESAFAFALIGDGERALDCLSMAEQRSQEAALEVAMARVAVEARVGDPVVVAGMVEETRRSLAIPQEREWRLGLEEIIAATRGAVRVVEPSEVERIRAAADRSGLGELADALFATGGIGPTDRGQLIAVTVLGNFSVSRNAEPIKVPSGRVTDLIKLLAVRSHPIPVEVIVDSLWPDSSLDVGRRRLKNIVNRCRAVVGSELVERVEGDCLSLGPQVSVDLRDFVEMFGGVSGDATKQLDLAVRAVDSYGGDLLPADLYVDWIRSDREAVRALAASALRTALELPAISADWALKALVRIRPIDEEIYLKVAVIAARAGELGCAKASLELRSDLCRYLGVPESALPEELDRLS